MDAKARDKALERARSLEKGGQGDAAAKLFREAGGVEDAARVLGALRRPRDAAELLLDSLGVPPAQAGRLDPAGKKRALMAAIFLGRSGEKQMAVQVFMALGEQQRAVELLQKAGDAVGAARIASMKPGQFDTGAMLAPAKATAVGGQAVSILSAQKMEEQGKLAAALEAYVQLKRFADAGRMAKALGRTADAAQFFADAGAPLEAAQAYLELGDTGKALDNFCRVPADDAQYRVAAAIAARLATNLNVLDFRFEHFVGAYVRSGPRDEAELQVFDLLGALYETHGFPENGREVLQKILAVQPSFPGARERLARLDQQLRPTAMMARQVLSNADLHKKRIPSLPDLGELPDMGDLPAGDSATMVRSDPALAKHVAGAQAAKGEEVIAEAEVLPDEPRTRAEKFEPGATLAGRYRLEGKIGQGGMATVFRAFDLELEENVALKLFNVEQTSEVLVARFKQELKLSRQLIHPNIIRLYDIGVHQGYRYISMELLVGKSLKDRMRAPIEFRTALGYLLQACHGLQAAHDASVVHRDVKPDNFFVTDDGVLKVMDFGIAKQYATPGVTVAGSIAGPPLYMSREQVGNFSAVTHLTDLYALGVCAYEMFTGQVPFFHEDLVPLLMMHEVLVEERNLAGEHLVCANPESVEVGQVRHRAEVSHLLARHVQRRACDRPGHGDPRRRVLLGDAEIHHLEHAVVGDEEVVRLHVAVHHAGIVRGLKAMAGLQEVAERGPELDRRPHPVLQALADQELHADVPVSLVHADVVEADDVRVDELAGELQLLLESRHQHFRSLLDVEELERDVLLQLQIEGAEHGRHAALADLPLQAIPPGERRTGLELLGASARLVRQHFRLRDHLFALRRLRARNMLREGRVAADHGCRVARRQIPHVGQLAQIRQRRDPLLVQG